MCQLATCVVGVVCVGVYSLPGQTTQAACANTVVSHNRQYALLKSSDQFVPIFYVRPGSQPVAQAFLGKHVKDWLAGLANDFFGPRPVQQAPRLVDALELGMQQEKPAIQAHAQAQVHQPVPMSYWERTAKRSAEMAMRVRRAFMKQKEEEQVPKKKSRRRRKSQ